MSTGRRSLSLRALATLAAALLIGACAGQAQPAASPTSQPATPSPTITATSTATVTPIPPTPTATLNPTPTLEPTPTLDPTTPLQGAALIEALRRGGYVVYFRHAATDQTQSDTDTQNLENCQTQRNLNDQGRADAQAIGAAFQALDIPIGQVLSSGYCRARDTAQLAFGRAEITPDLTGFPSDLSEQRIAALRNLLSTPPEVGTNTVLVAHGFNISNTANISIVEGEAAIFAPLGADGFALVARVLPEEWPALAELLGS
ncbi:MAG TPA: histidine phosphatase family protein [Anaerolineae bacterium]|nr:histidine phosphatase family protein [Anaerolineae bacterium]